MKVLLKSFKELKEEYDIERRDGYLLIDGHVVVDDMINLLGKIVEAEYEKETDSYFIDDCDFDPNFIKGIVIKKEYTIKNLSDSYEYTFSF